MNLRKYLAALLFIGLLVGALWPQGAMAVVDDDYYPLNVGNVWVYQPGNTGTGYRIDSVVGTEVISGTDGANVNFIWKRWEPRAGEHERRWMYKDSSDVLKISEFWSVKIMGSGGDPVYVDPPFVAGYLDPAAVTPLPYSWSDGVDLSTTVRLDVTYTVESVTDSVTVPAGTFNNCVKIKQYEVITNPSTGAVKERNWKRFWLAPNVGPIMYKKYTKKWATLLRVQKLVSYSLEAKE